MRLLEGVQIGRHKQLLTLKTAFAARALCQALPDYRKWNAALQAWVVRPSVANVEYLREIFRDAEWSEEAVELAEAAMVIRMDAERLRAERENLDATADPEVVDYRWDGVVQPWAHQKKAFLLSRDEKAFALLMEQRTGKTKVLIDTAAWQFLHGRIDALFVICPNGVKDVWVEEIEEHLPKPVAREVRVWDSKLGKAALEDLHHWIKEDLPGTLKVFIMNVEGLSTKRAVEWATKFVNYNRVLLPVDESTRIKSPGRKRTMAIRRLGKKAETRRILTGTPVTKNPLDLFSQFGFLDENILGFGSFYAFRNRFALMGGYEGKEIISFANLDELQELIAPYSFRVLAEDCHDLPPKSYQRIDVDLTKDQARLYKELATNMITEFEGQSVSVTLALTQYARLQQIAGGFISLLTEKGREGGYVPPSEMYESHQIPGKNPKLEALVELLPDINGKVLVWARYRPELALIAARLRAEYGDESVGEYHGGIDIKARTRNRLAFQDPDSPVRFFVGNPASGQFGLELSTGSTAIYFSGSFDLEERLQSEMRIRGAAQKNACLYIDLVARGTIDEKVREAYRSKKNLADLITGDTWTSWLQ